MVISDLRISQVELQHSYWKDSVITNFAVIPQYNPKDTHIRKQKLCYISLEAKTEQTSRQEFRRACMCFKQSVGQIMLDDVIK